MATKAERTIIVPDSMYLKIYKMAEKEQTNIPFVTRSLLVKALADERNRPDWFFEMQREVVGLRNDLLVAQRKKEKQDLAGEQLLLELKKQIADLTEALVVAPEKAKVEMEDKKAHEVLLLTAIEAESVEEVADIKQPENGKVIRPFFGRLNKMFSSVLS